MNFAVAWISFSTILSAWVGGGGCEGDLGKLGDRGVIPGAGSTSSSGGGGGNLGTGAGMGTGAGGGLGMSKGSKKLSRPNCFLTALNNAAAL